jgi:EpsI family protein
MNFRMRLAVAVGLFAACTVGKSVLASKVSAIRAKEAPTIDRKLADFPRTLGKWVGNDVPADAQMLKDIKSDDYMNRAYTHPSGERVVLWFNYSARSLDQYHYPIVCMRGAGWQEDESQRSIVPFAGVSSAKPDAPRPANCRMFFNRNQEKTYVLYWYYLIGEDPIDKQMRVASRYARVFLRGRQNPSLTVEVFSQSPNPDPVKLEEFATLVAAELDKWTPPGTETCCELGATY